MSDIERASIWKVMSSTAAVVSATTVFTVAAAGGIAWVAGYFAKRAEFSKFATCSAIKLDLLESQAESNYRYTLYVNAKANYLYRSQKPKPSKEDLEQWPGIEDQEPEFEIGRADAHLKASSAARAEAKRLAGVSQEYECEYPSKEE